MMRFSSSGQNIIVKDGMLVDELTGNPVIWYECDPSKNNECDKSICRSILAGEDHDFGFCAKTNNKKYRKDGSRSWIAVLKTSKDGGEPYWGRQYIEEDDHDSQ